MGGTVISRATRAVVLAGALTLVVAAGVASATTSAPPVGAPASDAELSSVPGATAYGIGAAIPLAAERPAWYTEELAARVAAADGAPVAAPEDAPLPSTVGIRPGAWMVEPAGCTMNFIFGSGSNLAIGTAGHCTEPGETVVLLTLAPGAENPVLVEIGRTLKSVDGGVGNDFALVEIRPELHSWVNPTTALIGGPCGAYGGSGPEAVAHYGHGTGIGTGGTPRAGLATTWQQRAYGWVGAAIFGDSGSPVRVTDLRAAGNLTHLVVDPGFLPSFIAGTRIGRMEEIAGSYTMVDSALCGGLVDGLPGGEDGSDSGNGDGSDSGGANRGGGHGRDGAPGRNRDGPPGRSGGS